MYSSDISYYLPSPYKYVHTVSSISNSSKWKLMATSPEVISFPGDALANMQFRVIAKYKKVTPPLEYSGKVLLATTGTVVTVGLVLFSDDYRGLFVKKHHRTYLAYYSNGGRGYHEITKKITAKMSPPEFRDLYDGYRTLNKPGITNGMLEQCLLVGNIHVMRFIIENFGDLYLNKKVALSDLIVKSVQQVYDEKLHFDLAKAFVNLLIKSGADLNKISRVSKKSEVLFERHQCDIHSPKTVLDSLHCNFINVTGKKWTLLQPIFKLIADQGGKASPGINCCEREPQSNNVPSIKFIQLPTPQTLPK